MSEAKMQSPHALLPLFPRSLTRRRHGFPGLAALLTETEGLCPALFLLVRVSVVRAGPGAGQGKGADGWSRAAPGHLSAGHAAPRPGRPSSDRTGARTSQVGELLSFADRWDKS